MEKITYVMGIAEIKKKHGYMFYGALQGVNFFFPDSHLAPKFFKVVANSKKVGRHFQRQTKPFFRLSAF